MPGTPLSALAHVVRSKNAGPTQLTIDVFFNDAPAYDRAAASARLSATAVAVLYRCDPSQVQRHLLPTLLAMKFTLPRHIVAGAPGDGDVYGAQQHAPLLEVVL
jgi:hypothetical protein